MASPQALLTLAGASLLAALILLVLGAIYFEVTNSELPPGLEQPAKLRVIHAFCIGTAVLGRILENLHICTQLQFVRLVQNVWRRKKDATLLVKETTFQHVPVRIYQPKSPSAGRRKGITFFQVAEDYGVDHTRVIITGSDVGGNLAAVVCQNLASRPGSMKAWAQILIYPILQAVDFNLPSYQQNQAVPVLFRERAAFYMLQYLTGEALLLEEVLEGSHVPVHLKLQYRKWLSADLLPTEFKAKGYKPSVPLSSKDEVYETVKSLTLPECSPLLSEGGVLHSLPKTFILTCEYDVLRDDGLLYKKRLEVRGIPVTWCHLANGFHGIMNFLDRGWFSFPSGKKGIDDTVSFLQSL